MRSASTGSALIAVQAGEAAAPSGAEPAEPEATTLPACRCCGGRMRIIEVFRRGYDPTFRSAVD